MEDLALKLNHILLLLAFILFAQDSIVLFIRGKNNRARTMLGITTFIWGVMYFIYFLCSVKGYVTYPIFSGESLISSHVFICVMFLFPMEVLVPRWLTWKRILLCLTPISVLTVIYILGLKMTGQTVEEFYSFADCWAAMWRFNVWYRVVLLVCNLVFLFVLMKILKGRELKYIRWQNENYSDLTVWIFPGCAFVAIL